MEMNNFLGTIINGLYDLANMIIGGVAGILPSFSVTDWLSGAFGEFSGYLGVINYFVPFGIMIDIAFAWVAAITIWYVAQFVLRFVQLGS